MDRFEYDGTGTLDHQSLPRDIATLVEDVDVPEHGFFGLDSTMWSVRRERSLFASGLSAILLQLAHPLVAAGVADHSDFDADPVGRFRRTFDYVHAIIFGDVDTAVEAALAVRELHTAVTGTIDEDPGRFESGDSYTATDPELLLWVHATLIEQSLTAYETYVEPLSNRDRTAYYQESKLFGQLFGIPVSAYPETLAEFFEYYERMLDAELAVGPCGRELQRALFRQGHVFGPLYATVGIGTLPDTVRDAYGLPWSSWRQRLFDAWTALVRATVPSLPSRLRYVDAYRRALERVEPDE